MNDYFNTTSYDLPVSRSVSRAVASIDATRTIFDESTDLRPKKVAGVTERGYVPWGNNNDLPNELIARIEADDVMAQNMQFNISCGYAGGIQVTPGDTPLANSLQNKYNDFFRRLDLPSFWLEQITDLKYFGFTVTAFIASVDRAGIALVVHKEANLCRFESCNPDTGKIERVLYANWKKTGLSAADIEVLPLLDAADPYTDLKNRLANGKETKFAIVRMIPSVGHRYYPVPPYSSVFRSGWYDLKKMIPEGKKAKFKNGMLIRYHIEIHPEYFTQIFARENITDPKKQSERAIKERENINNFLSGMDKAGKSLYSGMYVDNQGKEHSTVRITPISKDKEGGDWIADSEEANNILCYAMGVHPNLIGATPGKSSGGMSGSDKRELFTMKQALEKPHHDILLYTLKLVAAVNEFNCTFDVPFLMLTTLDKGVDAKPAKINNE